MTDPVYVVRLSSGQYLDSNGNFQTRPLAPPPTYDVPGGLFPVDFGSISKGLDATGAALSDFAKVDNDGQFTNDFAKQLVADGLNPDALKALGSIASVAKTLSLATGIIGVAINIASALFSLYTDKDAGIKAYLDKLFADQERLMTGIELTQRKIYLTDKKNLIDGAMVQLSTYQDEINNYNLTKEVLQARLADLHSQAEVVYNAVVDLASASPWNLSYDPADHWPDSLLDLLPSARLQEMPYRHGLYEHIYAHSGPPGGPGNDQLWTFPPKGAQVFDHRLMVPWVTYAVGSYLALITSLLPEYRTVGARQQQLRVLASLLDDLAQQMRGNLARSVYTAADFPYVFYRDITGFQPDPAKYNLVAGAIDMCAQDATYFNNEWGKRPWPITGVYGNLDVDFAPPALLTPEQLTEELDETGEPIPAFVIQNPEQCASATNQVANDQYAKLLMTSGHLSLLQLSALLRHLSTEPIRSETVGGQVTSLSVAGQSRETTAYSEQIPFVPGDGVIREAATLVPQQYQALARLTTQPLGRDDTVEYRIVLRTLRWLRATAPYDDYYETFYVRDPNPELPGQIDNAPIETALGYYRVDSHIERTVLIGEHPITGWMSTPPLDSTPITGQATLQADTFDLYVASPVLRLNAKTLRVGGWSEAMFAPTVSSQQGTDQTNAQPPETAETSIEQSLLPSSQVGLGVVSPAAVGVGALTDAGEGFGGGVPRHVRRDQVDVTYEVDWHGDLLDIRISADPAQRNYVLFLVIEEKLKPRNPNSTQLHSAYRMEVNNQTTKVPPSFFADEQAAQQRAQHILFDFVRRHVMVAPHRGPGDPIVNALRRGDLNTAQGRERLAHLAEQENQGLFREVLRAHGAP